MSQRYNDNTKKPRPKENQLRNLKRALGPGESCRGYISKRMQPKKLLHLPPKVAATLLSGSWKGAVVA